MIRPSCIASTPARFDSSDMCRPFGSSRRMSVTFAFIATDKHADSSYYNTSTVRPRRRAGIVPAHRVRFLRDNRMSVCGA